MKRNSKIYFFVASFISSLYILFVTFQVSNYVLMPKMGANESLNITTGQLIDEMIFFFTHCFCLVFFDFAFISLTFGCYVFIIAKMFAMRKDEQCGYFNLIFKIRVATRPSGGGCVEDRGLPG